MIYAYKCNVCGARIDSGSRHLTTCPECLNISLRRDYSSVQFGSAAFTPHFNHAVGSYVSSSRQFDDLLRIRGDEAQATYTRVDPGDVPQPSKEDHILETQARTIRDRNIDPATLVE
jgi:predicted nucleic acid-binding Zn ribbon protein